MKPADTAVRFHAGNQEQSIKMGISRGADEVFTILTLTNLYSDKILAVIREYFTNAWDSHLAAGNKEPVLVTLPTREKPEYIIEDFGLGLSADDLAMIFALYGASTKRDDEQATGMLGLGCKSALTYAVSFMLRATKDGVTTLADVSKGDDGVGVINILSTKYTGERNGVRVTVPVSYMDVYAFREKAEEFFFYCREGVLVDGEVPTNITQSDKHKAIDDDVFVRLGTSYYDNDSFIVQGGVAYPVPTRDGEIPLVAFVPMGSIDFTPSREAIHHTPRTDETIAMIRQWARDTWYRQLEQDVSQLSDYERIKFFHKLPDVLLPKFNGRRPVWAKLGLDLKFNGRNGFYCTNEYHSPKHKKIPVFKSEYATKDNVNWITGFPFKGFVSSHIERVRHAGIEYPYIVLPSTFTGVDLDSFPNVTEWEDIPSLPKEKRPSGTRSVTKYPTMLNKSFQYLTMDEIPEDATICYMDGIKEEDFRRSAFNWSEKDGSVYFVRLLARQLDRFLRLRPEATTPQAWQQTIATELHASVTETELTWRMTSAHTKNLARTFKEYEDFIDNDHFMGMLPDIPEDMELVNRLDTFGWPSNLGYISHRDHDKYQKMIRKHYPLIPDRQWDLNDNNIKDVILYINAKAAFYKEEE